MDIDRYMKTQLIKTKVVKARSLY